LPCVVVRLTLADGGWPPAFSYVSTRSQTLLGLEPSDLILDSGAFFQRVHAEDVVTLRAAIAQAFATGDSWHQEFRVRIADQPRWFEWRATVHHDRRARACAVGYLNDVTARKTADLRRAQRAQWLERAFDLAPQPMGIVDERRRITALNSAFVRTLGFSAEDAPTLDALLQMMFPDREYRERLLAEWSHSEKRCARGGAAQEPIAAKHRYKDGSEHTLEVRTSWVARNAIVILTDITDRLLTEEQLRLWKSVLEQSTEGILICDHERRIVAVNPAFERITGFTSQDAVGRTPSILHSGQQDKNFYDDMWRKVSASGHWKGEIWNRRKNGELYIQWMAMNAVHDEKGRLTHYVSIFSDISDRKAAEDRVRHLSQHDPLTDLPNRTLLRHRLDQLVEIAARDGLRIAVLFLDLDRFKVINDSMGHETGDLLLQAIARRIRDAVRRSDTVARMGGDEFVILLSELRRSDDAARMAEKMLAAVSAPVSIETQELSISASIGIAIFPEDGANASDLLRHADAAMYCAKSRGRNRYEFHAREMTEHATERLRIENARRPLRPRKTPRGARRPRPGPSQRTD
jgi:diguanylate cyclase (GGDEF)-like protein/PAS domain S-box-containing protein